MKLDYSLQTPEERKQLVEQIIAETPNPTPEYLEHLADYLVFCMEKEEKKTKKLLTENRMVTVNKRETSFEGLVSQMENGEDGIYNLITENKNTIFQPTIKITKQELEEIPFLRQVRESIKWWEDVLRRSTGRSAYIAKRAIIDLRKDQYIIRNAYQKPVSPKIFAVSKPINPLEDLSTVGPDGEVQTAGVTLMDPRIVSILLCNYSTMKQESWGKFEKDLWALGKDFDNISTIALKPYPLYERLVELKIDGLSNLEIQETLQKEFGIKHSVEYISSLWRNKIPKLIAAAAEEEFLNWYYTEVEYGKYKKCSRCGQIKLAHPIYFSRNKTSKDGYYSICKLCRKIKK